MTENPFVSLLIFHPALPFPTLTYTHTHTQIN